MTRSTTPVLALCAVGLAFSGCSGPEHTITDPYGVEPPTRTPDGPPFDHPPPPPAPIAVDRDKELLITNRAILGGSRSDSARVEAAWSFRHLVEELAPPGEAPAFVAAWLATWQATSTAPEQGSLTLPARPDVRAKLVCPWLRLTPANGCNETCSQCTSENLDLTRAPFRLLAIVNRLDLAETPQGCADDATEARFVFVATGSDGSGTLPFNVIFEYGAKGTEAGDAHAWHALARAGETYAAALERITRTVSDRGRTTLKQLRTSENLGAARGTSYELRQFERGEKTLVATALTNTARDAADGTTLLSEHVASHTSKIAEGDNAITSELRTAFSTMPRADYRWSEANDTSGMMNLFGLSTCNGCHAGHRGDTSVLPFSHVGANERGETVVSRFLDDPLNRQGDELAFRERSLARRLVGQCGSPDASYGGRHGGGGKGLEKTPPGPKRVH